MAHPTFIIDQAVRHFLMLWYHGLQPSLSFETDQCGAISISSRIVCLSQTPQPEVYFAHRSGKKSRLRRKTLRSSNASTKSNSEVKTNGHIANKVSEQFAFSTLHPNAVANVPEVGSDRITHYVDIEIGDGINDILNNISTIEPITTASPYESPVKAPVPESAPVSPPPSEEPEEQLCFHDKPLSELSSIEWSQLMDEIRNIFEVPSKL